MAVGGSERAAVHGDVHHTNTQAPHLTSPDVAAHPTAHPNTAHQEADSCLRFELNRAPKERTDARARLPTPPSLGASSLVAIGRDTYRKLRK